MVDARHGFAILGRWVLATNDGKRWAGRYRADAAFVYVDAIDAAHSWGVTRHSIVSTADGRTWRVTYTTPTAFTMVHFVDPTHGWAVDIGHGLYRTTDAGLHWQVQSTPCAVATRHRYPRR